jgi:hypothetical protein
VLAKRKGVVARRGLKEAWSKTATRRTATGYEAARVGRADDLPRSPYPSKARGCRSGGCAGKAIELTSGDLRRVSETRLRRPRGTLNPAQKSAEGIVGRAVGEAI